MTPGSRASLAVGTLVAQQKHETLDGETQERYLSTLTVFLSYSRDSDDHVAWVQRLGRALQSDTIRVLLDQWDLKPGTDLPMYMEQSVRDSDYVVLICTPSFAEKSNTRRGGVGYEQSIVTAELLAGVASETKFIPILRAGTQADSIPTALSSKFWLDARDSTQWDRVVAELRHTFHPPLHSDAAKATGAPIAQRDEDLEVFKQAHQFARSKSGLALAKWQAEEFASECQEGLSLDQLADFVLIFEFANREMKLARDDARAMAAEWISEEWEHLFAAFEDAFLFLRAVDGLKMSVVDARRFLEDFENDYGIHVFPRFREAVETALELGESRSKAEGFGLEQL